MENNEKQKSMKEHILSAIKSGQVEMRPKWHFVLKASLAALGAAILLLAILYLASFIIFALRQTGVLFVPVFGFEGWYAFFTHLPVFLIFLLTVFIIILELSVKRYSFTYRRPLLYSALGIFVLIIVGALAVGNSSLHSGMSRYAEKNGETFVGKFYIEYGRQKFSDVHRGMVVGMSDNGFVIRNKREENLTIVVSRRTRFPLGADFSSGDIVVIFGPRNDTFIQAFGIQKICDISEICD